MADPRLLPSAGRTIQVVVAVVTGLLALGVVLALVTYPGWRLAVAAVCALVLVPTVWVTVGSMLAPLAPGVTARRHLRSAVPSLAAVVLAVVGLMSATAPSVT